MARPFYLKGGKQLQRRFYPAISELAGKHEKMRQEAFIAGWGYAMSAE
jgi:hypothetical protein